MEPILLISNLNDFVFCPYSIYLHQVYGALDGDLYYEKVQIDGKNSHESIDNATHDTNAHVLLGTSIYSDKYGLMGKIDMFDSKKMHLTERKNQIKQIYDGYLLQLYAQYFCLIEMGFEVKSMGDKFNSKFDDLAIMFNDKKSGFITSNRANNGVTDDIYAFQYQIKDLRLFTENDVRFLKQFN